MTVLLVPLLLASPIAEAATPVFAPPLGRPLRYRVSEVRVEGERTLRFEVVRRVTFRNEGAGIVAEIETLSVVGDAGRAGRMFEAMARAMLDRRVMLTLDRAGKVVDVADLDAIWAAQVGAINSTLASKDPARQAVATRLLAPLQGLPRAAKIARVGDMIAPLIGDPIVTPRARRTITLPTRAPDGTAILLPGTEQVVLDADRSLRLERLAGGLVAGAPTTISQQRRLDPRTGLALETVNVSTVETAGARMIITRSSKIEP